MGALKFVFTGIVFLFLMQFSYSINEERYEWVDGTTAPLECIDVCKESGIYAQKKVNSGTQYLSNECKGLCFGEQAIMETERVQAEGNEQTTTQPQTGQDEKTIGSANEGETIVSQERNEEKERVNRTDTGEQNEIANQVRNSEGNSGEVKEVVAQKKEKIQEYVQARKQLHLEEFSNNSQVNITPSQIRTQGQEISAIAKTISAQVRSRKLNIKQNSDSISIIDEDGTSAEAPEVEIDGDEIRVGGIGLGLMPSEIKNMVKGELLQLRIEQKNGELIYEAKTNRKAKLFGIFDVEYEVMSEYAAQNGELKGSNKPIWSIFAFE